MSDTKLNAEVRKESRPSALTRRPLSDAALELVPWWAPPIPPWKPIKQPNSSLRIAAIVSDRLFDGLRFEGDLILLTPGNWKQMLEYGRPDLLIVESTWETATGHWYLAQNTPTDSSAELRDLVGAFRAKGVPTAYWITEDHVYHEHYREFAKCFDKVFCADPKETELLNAEGLAAHDLPPCVQPALYNPFRKHEEYDALDLGVLFDGWGDFDRNPSEYAEALAEICLDHRLSIIESRYLLTHNRLKATERLAENILGCASQESRILALKFAKATITFGKALSTPTTQRWEAMQATASYCPAIHFGSFPENDIRNGLVQSFGEDLEALVELIRMAEDDLYRQRIAHNAWRSTLQHHTFSHRLRQICETIGISHDWDEYPKVSVITPTCRPDMVPQAVATYRKQNYPNRELVLVYNGERPVDFTERNHTRDIQVTHVPGDRFAGAALNIGNQFATGSFSFRFDDDDFYGENYLLDMMMALRSVNADVAGKPMPPAYIFEGDDRVFAGVQTAFLIASGEALSKGEVNIPGNSIAFKADSAIRVDYENDALCTADAFFRKQLPLDMSIIICDSFNSCATRRNDLASHTWRIDSGLLKDMSDNVLGIKDIAL